MNTTFLLSFSLSFSLSLSPSSLSLFFFPSLSSRLSLPLSVSLLSLSSLFSLSLSPPRLSLSLSRPNILAAEMRCAPVNLPVPQRYAAGQKRENRMRGWGARPREVKPACVLAALNGRACVLFLEVLFFEAPRCPLTHGYFRRFIVFVCTGHPHFCFNSIDDRWD